MYQAPGREEAEQIIRRAEPELERLAGMIREGKPFPGPMVTWGGRVKSSIVNRLFYPLYVNAKGYYVTEGCVGCGRCVKLCPLNNIRLEGGKPVWGRKCTQCMACICGVPGPGRGVWKADSGEGAVLSDGGWDVGRGGGREGIAHRRPATAADPGLPIQYHKDKSEKLRRIKGLRFVFVFFKLYLILKSSKSMLLKKALEKIKCLLYNQDSKVIRCKI